MRISSGGVGTPVGGGDMVKQEMEGLHKTIEEQKKIIEEKQNENEAAKLVCKELEEKINKQTVVNVRIQKQNVPTIKIL